MALPDVVSVPQEVEETIAEIVEKTAIPVSVIKEEYLEILSEIEKRFPEFQDKSSQHKYAVSILWARYRARGPTKEVTVIPVGYTGLSVKGGEKRSKLFVVNQKGEKRMISFTGAEAEMYKSITLGARYTVRVMEFKSGNYGADNRTRFENPQQINVDLISLFRRLKVPEIESLAIASSPASLSKVQKTSAGTFVDSLDWRIVRGIVTNMRIGQRKDGTSFGFYSLSDTSLGHEETVDADGNVIPPTFTVWCDPSLMNWGPESEVYCVGTISVGKNVGRASMNAINVLPLFGRPVEGGQAQE